MDFGRMHSLNDIRPPLHTNNFMMTPKKDSVKHYNAHATLSIPKPRFESSQNLMSADKGPTNTNFFTAKSIHMGERPMGKLGGSGTRRSSNRNSVLGIDRSSSEAYKTHQTSNPKFNLAGSY